MEDTLYTVTEVGQILKIGKNRVYDLIHAGLLPALKLGGLKIRKSSLCEFEKNYEGYDLTDPFNPKPLIEKNEQKVSRVG